MSLENVRHVIVHTGQHYDPLFSDVFFTELGIPTPDYNLGIRGGEREQVIDDTQEAFANILPSIDPAVVLVYGDVNGAVGAARAAKASGYLLAHVEAGLRSFDASMPEELNRIAIDQLADVLLCSEQSGVEHLQREGVRGEVHLVGNTMIDTLVRMLPVIEHAVLPPDLPASYAVATLHRPSNVDDQAMLRLTVSVLRDVSSTMPILLPVHHRLQAALEKHGLMHALPPSIHLLAPQPYLSFLRLIIGARFILTDSGGIQEEATFLHKRCFTLRANTERPSTIECGSNVLIDLSQDTQRKRLLTDAKHFAPPHVTVPALWDGRAGEKIMNILLNSLSDTPVSRE
jgi:UDP-N-acetylglucosamine 2-epimerase (non-hydrolysing)